MLSVAGIRSNLAGAWALMNGRPEGVRLLDLSLDGFWRSFAAIVLVLPFAVVAMLGERTVMGAAGEALPPITSAYLVWRLIAFIADWLTFPLIFAVLARPLGFGRTFVPFIVARNWASVIAMAIAGLAHGLIVLGVLPPRAASLVLLFVLGLALRFSYCLARSALAAPIGAAVPIVVLDLVVSLVLEAAFGT